jgi:hypothetical protein
VGGSPQIMSIGSEHFAWRQRRLRSCAHLGTQGCQVYPEFEEESPCRRSGAAPSRALSSTGVSAKAVGAELERFAGRQRRGRSLAGLGGMEDSPDPENRPAERWRRRRAGGTGHRGSSPGSQALGLAHLTAAARALGALHGPGCLATPPRLKKSWSKKFLDISG